MFRHIRHVRRDVPDLTSGPVLIKMLAFALPLMFSGILQLLFNAADIIVVGKFAGDDSLAAVSATTALINVIINLFIGTSIGTNIVCANYIGGRRTRELSLAVHTSIALSIVLGLVIAVFGFFVSPELLHLMSTPETVIPLSSLYLKIYFLGLPAMMIYNFGAAILRSVGDTKHPLFFLFISGMVNVALNLLFVIGFSLDVAGVALATIVSEYISAFLVLRLLTKQESGIKLIFKKIRIDIPRLRLILKIGVPAGISSTVFSLSNVVIQADINYFGATVVAGNGAASSLDSFIFASMDAFYQADITFTSQSFGAGKLDRVPRIFFSCLLTEIGVSLIMGGALYAFSTPLLEIYTNSDAVIAAGAQRISVMFIGYAFCGIMDAASGSLRGIGSSIFPMISSILFICVFRVIYLGIALPYFDFASIDIVYWSFPLSWVIAAAAMCIAFFVMYRKMKNRAA